jgi:DNA-binding response OmpR family regulator
MQEIVVDVEMRQIRREGLDPLDVTPQEVVVMAMYVAAAPRPVHDERIFANQWAGSPDPRDNLKVFVWKMNKRLAGLNLMLRRSYEFGYYLVNSPKPAVMAVQAAKDAVMEAVRG